MYRFHGAISRDYDLVLQAIPNYFELQAWLADFVGQHFVRGRVVDVGVGTGVTTQAVLARSRQLTVAAVDDEPFMIDHAQRNLATDVEAGRVTIHFADALEFLSGLGDMTVDVVVSAFTIHNCLKSYRLELQQSIMRVLKCGGLFINCDKFAADDRAEYVRELTDQIVRFDLLSGIGREDLRRAWIEHEVVDQLPERVMWAEESLGQLRADGFAEVALRHRAGQYAIATARKPGR